MKTYDLLGLTLYRKDADAIRVATEAVREQYGRSMGVYRVQEHAYRRVGFLVAAYPPLKPVKVLKANPELHVLYWGRVIGGSNYIRNQAVVQGRVRPPR